MTVRRSDRSFHIARATPFAIVAVALAAACANEPKLPPIDAATHSAAWEKWMTSRTKWLSIPGRPMSYTALTWIHEGTTTIGGDSTNAVRLQGSNVPAKFGILIRTGKTVRFEPTAGVPFTVDSQPSTATSIELRTDAASKASIITVGSAGFRIAQRVDSIGVRAWDADKVSPEAVAKQIAPLSYFPLDEKWRIAGSWQRREKPETVAVATSAGVNEEHIILGTVGAKVDGKPVNLLAYAGNSPTDLYITFSDESSGEETYGFRFVHAALDTVAKLVTLDLNYAYNPDCAFSAYTTCALPTTENRIGVKVLAGEKAVVYLKDSVTAVARKASLAKTVRGGVAAPAGATPNATPSLKP